MRDAEVIYDGFVTRCGLFCLISASKYLLSMYFDCLHFDITMQSAVRDTVHGLFCLTSAGNELLPGVKPCVAHSLDQCGPYCASVHT